MTDDEAIAKLAADHWYDDVYKVNGVPLVVFPFGFKKAEWNGQTVLIPLTEPEARQLLIEGGKDFRLTDQFCGRDMFGCRPPVAPCRECSPDDRPGARMCTCTN